MDDEKKFKVATRADYDSMPIEELEKLAGMEIVSESRFNSPEYYIACMKQQELEQAHHIAELNRKLNGKTIAFIEAVQVNDEDDESRYSRSGDGSFSDVNGYMIAFADGTAVFTKATYSDSKAELVFDSK